MGNPLRVNLAPLTDVTLDGESPEFEGTEFEGFDFSVSIRPLDNLEKNRIAKAASKITKSGMEFDMEEAKALQFCAVVTGWEGITDAKGKVIECNEENKRAIAATLDLFVNAVLSAATPNRVIPAEVEEAEEKN